MNGGDARPGEAAAEPMRPGEVPWLRVALAFAAAFVVGLVGAWIVQLAGWWTAGGDWERRMLVFAHATVSPILDVFFLWMPYLGTNYTMFPFVVIACVLLWRKGYRVSAIHLGVIQLGSALLNFGLKNVLLRPRPDLFEHRGQYAMSAYPSGHSIAITSVLLTAAYLMDRHGWGDWPYYVVGLIFLANNWSRVYLGVHWPTDVLGGIAVGAVWLFAGIMIFRPFYDRYGPVRES
mgnify:CR=1 FL=1